MPLVDMEVVHLVDVGGSASCYVSYSLPFFFFSFFPSKSLWSGISQKLENTDINLRCFGRATEQVFQSLLA